MYNHMQEPIDVVRQQLRGEHPVDEDVLDSMAVLTDRLETLKSLSPMFQGIGFSPDIEAMMTAQAAMTVN